MDKEKIIKEVYYDPAGFGTPSQTLKDAKEKDAKNVMAWFAKNVQRKSNLKGYNIFIPQRILNMKFKLISLFYYA